MKASFFIARRYLRSPRNSGFVSFLTLFAVLGISVGVATLIIASSILEGFERTIKENVISFTAHMQVYGFQGQVLQNPESAARKVKERYREVEVMAPYLAREAMIRSESGIDGVLLKGIDPGNDISAARKHLLEGAYDLRMRNEGVQKMVIGKRLAERLAISVGDKVLVFALGGLSLLVSQTRVMQFEVAGVYETGMEEYDASYVYTNIESAQRLFQVGKAVSGFDVLVSDLTRVKQLAEEIPADLGYPYYARTMFQTYRNLFAWIDLQKTQIPIILRLIIVVATVNIIGALLMMVMEKTKDIGALRAVGAPRKTILEIFMFQGMFIGLVGTIAGNVLAYVLCWIEINYRLIALPSGIYYMTHVPIDLSAMTFLVVSVSAFLLCCISSLVPSIIAAVRDPVNLLRFAS